MRVRVGMIVACGVCLAVATTQAQTREEKVRADKARVEAEGFWIYNDLERGFAEARRTGKPLLVNMRCIPCEECVKLDDDLVDRDPVVRPLLDEFVCVRIVGTNGLDLSLFQYDTDQSFAVFLLNADGVVYGRFGTRSHRTEWVGDVSVAGMARALEGALELHADYPDNRAALAAKRGPEPRFASPEKYPSLSEKYTATLNYSGAVVQSCIHCHQIGDAERELYRSAGEPIPEQVLFPYPHPKSLGLVFDPRERATLRDVVAGSPAADAGFRAGDRITSLAGQPLLSIADVQWVLHQTDPGGGELVAQVERGGEPREVVLDLEPNWRRRDDIAWRVSSWGLRRMATGGLKLAELDDDERGAAKIADGKMALVVEHVGQYGAHAAAKRAGFQEGDVLVEYDGRDDLVREADLMAHGVTQLRPGDEAAVVVLRDGRRIELALPMQE